MGTDHKQKKKDLFHTAQVTNYRPNKVASKYKINVKKGRSLQLSNESVLKKIYLHPREQC